jgi:hypothetical protein
MVLACRVTWWHHVCTACSACPGVCRVRCGALLVVEECGANCQLPDSAFSGCGQIWLVVSRERVPSYEPLRTTGSRTMAEPVSTLVPSVPATDALLARSGIVRSNAPWVMGGIADEPRATGGVPKEPRVTEGVADAQRTTGGRVAGAAGMGIALNWHDFRGCVDGSARLLATRSRDIAEAGCTGMSMLTPRSERADSSLKLDSDEDCFGS